jgi:hypothetical protein
MKMSGNAFDLQNKQTIDTDIGNLSTLFRLRTSGEWKQQRRRVCSDIFT